MSEATYAGLLFTSGSFSGTEEHLAHEQALRISLNDTPFTVTMHTPGSEKELVRGLLFTEDVFTGSNADFSVRVTGTDESGKITSIDASIPEDQAGAAVTDIRHLASVSSCGLCGKTEIPDSPDLDTGSRSIQFEPRMVETLFRRMKEKQRAFDISGGTHAAAAFDEKGRMLAIHEDIGRHNAVDKVIGSLLMDQSIQESAILLVSGRISFEIVNKALRAGIPILASVSAPSDLAVRTADIHGLTLLAFCRGEKFTIYTHPGRFIGSSELNTTY